MASSVIHICIANEVNKQLKMNNKKVLLGTIAPDIAKLIGENKRGSHFADNEENNIPNLDKFLEKYKSYLYDDFVMGYYIHLYADYLWAKYFTSEIIDGNQITKIDGTVVTLDEKTKKEYMYNDYTNLNIQLIDEYNLELSLFFEELPKLNTIIDEIPYEKLNIIVNQAGIIIENAKQSKEYFFNLENIKNFIELSTDIITGELNELNFSRLELI